MINEEKWKNMLTYGKIYEIILYPHYNYYSGSLREVHKMAEFPLIDLNISLRESAYYLIGFFFKTQKKYSCTQTKLGKMLSILAFKYAVNGQRLFDEKIYKYLPDCGTFIKEMTFIASKDVYTRSIENENPDKVCRITEKIDNCVEIPIQFRDTDSIPNETKNEIENLFIRFGAYPADDLGKLLNPIVNKIFSSDTNEVILDNLLNSKKDSFETDNNNDIVNYIFE